MYPESLYAQHCTSCGILASLPFDRHDGLFLDICFRLQHRVWHIACLLSGLMVGFLLDQESDQEKLYLYLIHKTREDNRYMRQKYLLFWGTSVNKVVVLMVIYEEIFQPKPSQLRSQSVIIRFTSLIAMFYLEPEQSLACIFDHLSSWHGISLYVSFHLQLFDIQQVVEEL